MNVEKRLLQCASNRGLRVVDRGQGHFQIVGGPLLVNYYPLAKKQSAYIAGTVARRVGVTPEQAVEMAFAPPPIAAHKDERKANYRSLRRRMLKKSDKCHWCHKQLTLDTSTIEHIIPLHRGGLDNANNRVLACEECNLRRGHAMPELTSDAAHF